MCYFICQVGDPEIACEFNTDTKEFTLRLLTEIATPPETADVPEAETVVAKPRSIDDFGPYFIEQYILMEVLSKQEVAQNVMDYYVHQKEKLQQGRQREHNNTAAAAPAAMMANPVQSWEQSSQFTNTLAPRVG